jgi:hypothetical protein
MVGSDDSDNEHLHSIKHRFIYLFIFTGKGTIDWSRRTSLCGVSELGRLLINQSEGIGEDIQIMEIRGWRKLCKERAEWKKITEKAKTHSGL